MFHKLGNQALPLHWQEFPYRGEAYCSKLQKPSRQPARKLKVVSSYEVMLIGYALESLRIT